MKTKTIKAVELKVGDWIVQFLGTHPLFPTRIVKIYPPTKQDLADGNRVVALVDKKNKKYVTAFVETKMVVQ